MIRSHCVSHAQQTLRLLDERSSNFGSGGGIEGVFNSSSRVLASATFSQEGSRNRNHTVFEGLWSWVLSYPCLPSLSPPFFLVTFPGPGERPV